MSNKEKNQYILGTEWEELHRLGFQHQVWSGEARKGWANAGFTHGQTLLDLGCGPGFCTRDMAYMVGKKGKVIGVDKSEGFIKFLATESELHQLPIEAICSDFDNLDLKEASLDGIYCRWALAWIPNVREILDKLYGYLKPGGTMVFHEYYDWSTLQTEPSFPSLDKCIAGALRSFMDAEGNINIGRLLPGILTGLGMKIEGIRPMTKLVKPTDLAWNWPKTFFQIYFPKLVEMNIISEEELRKGLEEFSLLESRSGATIHCPLMVEVLGVKT